MDRLRIIFMGTPALARTSLKALSEWPGAQLVAVVTQPDRPKGRDLKLRQSAVKELAMELGLPVFQPLKARDESFQNAMRELRPDLIAVAAFGQILPESVLQIPRYGCLNVHTSLLPRHRGAAPIQRCILEGDAETGVTIMRMDAGLDTGDIVAQERTSIDANDTSETLHDRLAEMGATLLVRTIPGYVSGEVQPRRQPGEGVTVARKITKEEGLIDWKENARNIWNKVRGLQPWPSAYTFIRKEGVTGGRQLLKIWEAEPAYLRGVPGEVLKVEKDGIIVACGTDSIRLKVVQREGGRRVGAQEFISGCPLRSGWKLG